jgi:hypothetical protein
MRETVTAGTDIQALRHVQIGINGGYQPSTLAFIASEFDAGQIAHDHRAPDRDRLLIARLEGIVWRHAGWGGLTAAEKAAGVAELQEIAGDRSVEG